MKKLVNAPADYVDQYLEGILLAHPDRLQRANGNIRGIVTVKKIPGKVVIVTGGGSGHLPLFLGYVGEGLLDGCAVGNVFASPSSTVMLATASAVESGGGVLFLFGNYGGDKMNFEMAAEDLEKNGVKVCTVICCDDVASAPRDKKENRRGVAGILFAYKVAGAAAARMMNLDEVTRLAQKANEHTRTMGVAFSACTLPEVGTPSFVISEDEMEIGMGIHGEPGVNRGKMKSADEIVDKLVNAVQVDLDLKSGQRTAVLINGLGGTCKEELYIAYRRVHKVLTEKGIKPAKVLLGEYSTSMEMAGFSISLMLLDDELEFLLGDYGSSPFMVFENGWK
jgi:dihydroxyacetone kinase-like protein